MTKGGKSLKIKNKDGVKITWGRPLQYYKDQLKNRTDLDPAHKRRLEQIIEDPKRFGIKPV